MSAPGTETAAPRAFAPKTLRDAIEILADPDLGAIPVAGCTDVLVVDAATRRTHRAVVDLLRIPELRGIREEADALDIGAACTFSEIQANETIRREFPILAEVASTIGGWQIQNRATLGGNIANASPAGDSLPVLLALDAELRLAGPAGERTIPYTEMHVGYRKTALGPGELIVRARLPRQRRPEVQLFKKVGTREAQAISKVVVAFSASRQNGCLGRVRLAAGSVAEVPVRLRAAEEACEGKLPDPETARTAGAAARGEVRTIDDVRSTAAYRAFVLERIVRRMVLQASSR